MSAYRTAEAPRVCTHIWKTNVVHHSFGDPSIWVGCTKCYRHRTGLAANLSALLLSVRLTGVLQVYAVVVAFVAAAVIVFWAAALVFWGLS